MNTHEAEQEILKMVKQIDAIRVADYLDAETKQQAIARIDAQIRDLKRITGQRRITGKGRRG